MGFARGGELRRAKSEAMTLLDNLILLLAAALVTGLLVPFIAARMNAQRLVRQRQAEEDIARDSKFIEAQTEFLDRVSTDLWRLAGKLLAVSYYAGQSQQQFADAWRHYDESSFDELFALRANVSRAQRLLSAQAQQQLSDFHLWLFGNIDPEFTSAARRALKADDERTQGQWSTRHTTLMAELFTRIDAVLVAIADDVGAIQRQR
jgi:uncharacterized membrane-anchored protein YhcB (DUF1043 family)